jgi:hypothetical protein
VANPVQKITPEPCRPIGAFVTIVGDPTKDPNYLNQEVFTSLFAVENPIPEAPVSAVEE